MQEPYPQRHGGHREINASLERRTALGSNYRLAVGAPSVAAVGIYAGLYNIAADVPHTRPVYWLFETVRERSVAVRAEILLFQTIWMIRTASQKVRANMRRCAAVVILRPA